MYVKNSTDAQIAVDNRNNIIFFENLSNLLDKLDIENEKVGAFLHNLGLIYNHLGFYSKAEPLYLKVVKIFEKVLGEDNPNTVISYNNLAGLYGVQGEYKQAESFYLKAIKIFKRVLGEEHPNTAGSYNNLVDSTLVIRYNMVWYMCDGRYSAVYSCTTLFMKIDV